MAFHNTNERYEYIYGSSARKLAPAREPYTSPKKPAGKPATRKVTQRTIERRAMEKAQREAQEAERHRAWFLEFDWKYTVVVVAAVLICSLACLFYVSRIARINRMQQDIYNLKAQKMELVGKNTALRAEVDKAINLEQVETYAIKRLKMKYPDSNNIIHYTVNSGDYFRKYNTIDVK